MKLKPFKAWLLWDATETYAPTIHATKGQAQDWKKQPVALRDAKWRIDRVVVSPSTTGHKG